MTENVHTFRIPTAQGQLQAQRWRPIQTAALDRAPVVLLHDSLGSVALWRDFPAQLAEATQRTVLAYDRLGFGLSDAAPGPLAPDFVAREAETFGEVCQAMGMERFVALGHSVGGGMAAHVAAAYPQQCAALVTASAQTFVEARTLEGIRVARDQFAQPGQLERLARYHGDKAAWVLSAWVETWLSPAFADYSLEAALRQVRCPVLAIHGEKDEYGSLAHPRNIAAWVPGPVEQEIVAGGGHVPHREQPERMVARIAQFLQAVE
jgi:pimeloyl-ACP methyl ester carboxylesterase